MQHDEIQKQKMNGETLKKKDLSHVFGNVFNISKICFYLFFQFFSNFISTKSSLNKNQKILRITIGEVQLT